MISGRSQFFFGSEMWRKFSHNIASWVKEINKTTPHEKAPWMHNEVVPLLVLDAERLMIHHHHYYHYRFSGFVNAFWKGIQKSCSR